MPGLCGAGALARELGDATVEVTTTNYVGTAALGCPSRAKLGRSTARPGCPTYSGEEKIGHYKGQQANRDQACHPAADLLVQ